MDLSSNTINTFEKDFDKYDKYTVAKNAITNNNLLTVILNNDFIQNRKEIFAKKIDIDVKSSNQNNSGRCWLFAFLNVMRLKMIEKYKLNSDFEFSQTYLFFYDKLEKANYFLNKIIENKKEPSDSRIMTFLLNNPISDGGQYNMAANLINKYGIIPSTAMKETFQSNNTHHMNQILKARLKYYAYMIHENKYSNLDTLVKKAMNEIYRILVIFLGKPVTKFTWEYNCKKGGSRTQTSKKNKRSSRKKEQGSRKKKRDSRKKKSCRKVYNVIKNITPLDFYKKIVPFNVDDHISLIHNPMRPYNKVYNVKYVNNMKKGNATNYINVPINILKETIIKSINNKDAIGFASEIDFHKHTKLGLLDKNLFNYKDTFGFELEMEKKDALKYYNNSLKHAMVFKGYTKNADVNNKSNKKGNTKSIRRWLVENSWGDETGKHGNFTMGDSWFDDYVYQIVVHKKYVPRKLIKLLKAKPVELAPWDPFGELLI